MALWNNNPIQRGKAASGHIMNRKLIVKQDQRGLHASRRKEKTPQSPELLQKITGSSFVYVTKSLATLLFEASAQNLQEICLYPCFIFGLTLEPGGLTNQIQTSAFSGS